MLFSVKLFKRFVDDFKNAAREKRYVASCLLAPQTRAYDTCKLRTIQCDPPRSFTVREYTAEASGDGNNEEQRRKLQSDKKALEEKLASWCRQNFAEAFIAWIHLKAIRLFVESVLRYGLPINIRGIVMQVRVLCPVCCVFHAANLHRTRFSVQLLTCFLCT